MTVRHASRDDAEPIQEFVRGLTPETKRLRYFCPLRELSPAMLAQLTLADPPRTMVLIATPTDVRADEVIAIAQYAPAERHIHTCELGIVVADRWQNRGLGSRLVMTMNYHAGWAGFTRVEAQVWKSNARLVHVARKLGFTWAADCDDSSFVRLARAVRLSIVRMHDCVPTGRIFERTMQSDLV